MNNIGLNAVLKTGLGDRVDMHLLLSPALRIIIPKSIHLKRKFLSGCFITLSSMDGLYCSHLHLKKIFAGENV